MAVPRSGDGYVLFLARDGEGGWQILCPSRTLATVDGAGIVRIVARRPGQRLLSDDVRDLDRELRAFAQ
ncbi:MAG: hypothetical protein M3T56_02545 [Chloroflexota bacterium]|nr:hypothetical protein [Chloroflexota bacterium]